MSNREGCVVWCGVAIEHRNRIGQNRRENDKGMCQFHISRAGNSSVSV